jgi:hypothetical protein
MIAAVPQGACGRRRMRKASSDASMHDFIR